MFILILSNHVQGNAIKMKYSLQQLSDRMEIEDLLVEYADAIDNQEIDRLDEVFTPDAQIDYSAFGGVVGGYPEARLFLQEAMPAFKTTQHMISNYRIHLNGDRATGKIMCFNPMELDLESKMEPDIEKQLKPLFFLGLWYLDEYQRTDKGWRISKREEVKAYDYNTPDFIRFSGN